MANNIGRVRLLKKGGWVVEGYDVLGALEQETYATKDEAEAALVEMRRAYTTERQTRLFGDDESKDLPGQQRLF